MKWIKRAREARNRLGKPCWHRVKKSILKKKKKITGCKGTPGGGLKSGRIEIAPKKGREGKRSR